MDEFSLGTHPNSMLCKELWPGLLQREGGGGGGWESSVRAGLL